MFTTAAVIGTGMMGPGIAATLAMGGVRATILSRTLESAERGLEASRGRVRFLAENELVDAAQAAQALGLLRCSAAFDETVAASDLIVESGPEDMAFKRELFARLDAISKPQAVL